MSWSRSQPSEALAQMLQEDLERGVNVFGFDDTRRGHVQVEPAIVIPPANWRDES